MYTIYQIRNKLDGKIYIGSAKNFTKRKSTHIRLLKKGSHHSRYLQNAWNKHGEVNFEFSILQKADEKDAYNIENQLIESLKPEYNMMMCVFSHIGMKRSNETCKKISKALTGKPLSEEHKEKVRQANLGKKQSQSTKDKRAKALYKPIAAYDKITGVLVKKYESTTEAAKELGCRRTCISDVLNNRKNKKSYKGFIWKKL